MNLWCQLSCRVECPVFAAVGLLVRDSIKSASRLPKADAGRKLVDGLPADPSDFLKPFIEEAIANEVRVYRSFFRRNLSPPGILTVSRHPNE